ncbi:MAG: hypothetical protein RL065_66 [Bacteroidota bacterium]
MKLHTMNLFAVIFQKLKQTIWTKEAKLAHLIAIIILASTCFDADLTLLIFLEIIPLLISISLIAFFYRPIFFSYLLMWSIVIYFLWFVFGFLILRIFFN